MAEHSVLTEVSFPHDTKEQFRSPAMAEGSTIPKVSFVIEWDNARLSEAGRTKKMLQQLQEQVAQLGARTPFRPEFIILYDRFAVDRHFIEQIIHETVKSQDLLRELKIIASDGLSYYDLKNFGARQAHGDVIVFLDSDVIPEDGWLAGLLSAFQNPAVQVVCGGTYISLEGLYSKAVALFWFFPIREEGDGLCQTDQFFANNIAFRREVFESNPFPCLPQYRGQCVALAGQLKERGIPIFRQRSARVAHPPPNGLRHFICRALIAGHDAVIEGKRHSKDDGPQFASCYWIYWRYRESLGSSFARIRRHYRDVGLGRMGLVGAAAIAWCYYTLKLAGELLARLRPELVRRYFAI